MLADGVDRCRASNPAGISFGDVTPTWASWATSDCAGDELVVENVVVRVNACRLSDPAALTMFVAQSISTRINP